MISNGVKKLIPQSIKNIYHLFQAVLANVWFGFPSRKLKVIGVTGTNGKTTTVQMITKILEKTGKKVAVASTINFKIGNSEWVNDTKFTTLSGWRLQKHLRAAVKADCGYAVVEVTSHALDQYRVWGVDFKIAVITNVTREHLDYHQTMEKYAKAKAKLFEIVSKNKDGVAVVNLDMANPDNFLSYPIVKKYGYGIKAQSGKEDLEIVKAEDIELGIDSSKFRIKDSSFQLHLPGDFNIENALAAICVGLSQEIALPQIAEALAGIKNVPGRMQRIENDRGHEIIVDYAVTPDSLMKLYEHISGSKKGNSRIIAVFGSCGDRDRGKRPIMGQIVARFANYCFVTNEDPYDEDPQQIIDEVFGGVINPKIEDLNSKQLINSPKQEGVNAWRIMDRREAIKKALQMAEPEDIVVVTGKGAEETMAIGEKRIAWNDPKEIQAILLELETEKSRSVPRQ